jgi:hypothetical protein
VHPRYVRQSRKLGYSCCQVIALLNALRFHGIPTIGQNSREWQEVVDRCL